MQCVVYKSLKQFDYYLYLNAEDGFARVPEGLRHLLGQLEEVVTVELHPDRVLAQADVAEVMQQIRAQGYYLQMPRGPDTKLPVA